MKNMNIGIFGAGNMGEALIRGLKKQNQFMVYVQEKNPDRLNRIIKKYKVKKNTLEQLTNLCKIIIICVKPQDLDSVINLLKSKISSKHTVISIAAGVSTKFIEETLKSGKPKKSRLAVVRVMPNMPGMIGEGISAYCLGRYATAHTAKLTEKIFSTLGQVIQVREKNIDAVTALSGSGPGFMAYIMQEAISAACKMGLDIKIAKELCLQTVKGTALFLINTKTEPSILVKKVSSTGGTTEAGLKVLKNKNVRKILEQTLNAAKKRAKELNRD